MFIAYAVYTYIVFNSVFGFVYLIFLNDICLTPEYIKFSKEKKTLIINI